MASPRALRAWDTKLTLRDPDRRIRFPIANEFTPERVLTPLDVTTKLGVELADGTVAVVDEDGPFLLLVDRTGRLLIPPLPFPDPEAPDQYLVGRRHPFLEEAAAVRVMNALGAEATRRGAVRRPVFAPWHALLMGVAQEGKAESRRANLDEPGQPGRVGRSGLRAARAEIFEIGMPSRTGFPSLKEAGFPIVTWTVNDETTMRKLLALGVDGIITDRPDVLMAALRDFDGNGDGTPDYLLPNGNVDASRFDAQGHRGARDLRPENTLPAMEVAIDLGMTTLEVDLALTRDDVPVIDHDPDFRPSKSRRLDGSALPPLVKDLTFAELQHPLRGVVSDGLLRRRTQRNDPSLSPVSVAFAMATKIPHPYMPPSLDQLFSFVSFYERYYRTGEGAEHPEAALRAERAATLRFNLEVKTNPRVPDRTKPPEDFVEAIARRVIDHGLEARTTIQSFDFRNPLLVVRRFPEIRVGFLFADFPICPHGPEAEPRLPCGDGTNMQPENIHDEVDASNTTPWMAGLYWPYRQTTLDHPVTVPAHGRFVGIERAPEGDELVFFVRRSDESNAPPERYPFRFDVERGRFRPDE